MTWKRRKNNFQAEEDPYSKGVEGMLMQDAILLMKFF